MELRLDVRTGDLHLGDEYVIKHGMTKKELLAPKGIEKLFYGNAVYSDSVYAMIHPFDDRGHSVCMRVGFEFKDEHPENARIHSITMKLDDATARTYAGIGLLEYMDIEDGYVDYVRKITGVTNFLLDDAIYFEDAKGMVLIEKTMQAPDLTIYYEYPEV